MKPSDSLDAEGQRELRRLINTWRKPPINLDWSRVATAIGVENARIAKMVHKSGGLRFNLTEARRSHEVFKDAVAVASVLNAAQTSHRRANRRRRETEKREERERWGAEMLERAQQKRIEEERQTHAAACTPRIIEEMGGGWRLEWACAGLCAHWQATDGAEAREETAVSTHVSEGAARGTEANGRAREGEPAPAPRNRRVLRTQVVMMGRLESEQDRAEFLMLVEYLLTERGYTEMQAAEAAGYVTVSGLRNAVRSGGRASLARLYALRQHVYGLDMADRTEPLAVTEGPETVVERLAKTQPALTQETDVWERTWAIRDALVELAEELASVADQVDAEMGAGFGVAWRGKAERLVDFVTQEFRA